VSGNLERPEFGLNLEAENLSLKNFTLPAVKIKADGNLDNLNLRQFEADFKEGQLTVTGRWPGLQGSHLLLTILTARLNLSKLT